MRLFIYLLLLAPLSMAGQLSELSDEFNRGCSLNTWIDIEDTEGWANTHMESIDVNSSNEGMLTMIPYTTGWYQSRRSTLRYKEVTGDFVFTAEISAMSKEGNGQPGSIYSLAGLMIRGAKDMSSGEPVGAENYIFISIGSANVTNVPKFEVKNTVNDNSTLYFFPISGTTAQIRMVRVGTAVLVMYKMPGSQWVVQDRFNRALSQIPLNAQVGFVSYTDWGKVNTYTIPFHNENTLNSNLDPDPSSNPSLDFNPDLVAQFDYGRFEDVDVPTAYENANFASSSEVPDNVILDIFGYNSVSHDLEGWKIWKGNSSDWNDASNWVGGVVPTVNDSIVIPNCACPEVVFPSISGNNITISSLIIEQGGQLSIGEGGNFSIDLSGINSLFHNQGSIINSSTLTIENSIGKTVLNDGSIECLENAICNFN